MAKFKDSTGREWSLALSVGLLGRLRTEAGFELGQAAAAGERFGEFLFGDPERVARVLWVMAGDQAAGVTPEQFAAGLDGDALDAAAVAFMEAVLDFFHRGRSAPMKERLPRLVAKLNRDTTTAMAAAVDAMLNDSAGNSPASPESTPAP